MQAGKRHTMLKKMPLETHPFFKAHPILSVTPVTAQGYCNLNYKVTTASGVYLVRQFVNDEVDREKEYLLQQQAAAAGLAPEVILFDRERGCMVMPFIQGVHYQELDEKALGILAGHIKTLHDTLTYDETPLDLKRMIRSEETAIIEAFEVIAHYPQEQAVCHNDLNPLNLIWQDETFCLLDFEYAGVNDRYFDLAALSVEFSLSEDAQKYMMQCYFTGNWFRKKLDAYKVLYRQLCKEWFLIVDFQYGQ